MNMSGEITGPGKIWNSGTQETWRNASSVVCSCLPEFQIHTSKEKGETHRPRLQIVFASGLIVLRRAIRQYVHAVAVLVEQNLAVHECEQGPIPARANILACD